MQAHEFEVSGRDYSMKPSFLSRIYILARAFCVVSSERLYQSSDSYHQYVIWLSLIIKIFSICSPLLRRVIFIVEGRSLSSSVASGARKAPNEPFHSTTFEASPMRHFSVIPKIVSPMNPASNSFFAHSNDTT